MARSNISSGGVNVRKPLGRGSMIRRLAQKPKVAKSPAPEPVAITDKPPEAPVAPKFQVHLTKENFSVPVLVPPPSIPTPPLPPSPPVEKKVEKAKPKEKEINWTKLIPAILKQIEWDESDLASELDVSIGAVRKWMEGQTKPRADIQAKLVELVKEYTTLKVGRYKE